MSSGSDDGPGQVDWLTSWPPPGAPDRRRRRILVSVLLVAVAAAVLGPVLGARDKEDDPVRSAPTPSSERSPTRAATSSPSPVTRPVVVQDSGPLLGGLDGEWELFARTDDTVYRIEVRAGRVTATQHETLNTTGPVTFIADARGVILRPLDEVTGVAVPDGQRARPLRGSLEKGGYLLPGPPGSVWVGNSQVPEDGTREMRLVRFDGTATSMSVSAATGYFRSDGAGGLLLEDVGGVWQARPEGLRRITTGGVAAVGRRHYLLVGCDGQHSCRSWLYTRQGGTQRRLAIAYPGWWYGGVVSPDGRYAAFTSYDGSGQRPTLRIVDLQSSKTLVRTAGSEDGETKPQWSPDGRWLGTLLDGRLVFIDLRTGRRVTPPLRLPQLLQVTSRTQF